jgi:hypothetical protein
MNSVFNSILRPIYTKQLLPRTVAYNLFPAWIVLCKSSTHNVDELFVCLIYTVQLTF